jgi:tripartite-type tricarboxylate transporter receptor subunit TctC
MDKARFAALLLTASALPVFAHAASYPERAIQLIVPFAAGGGADVFARTISAPLAQELGQPVVVVNKPGAGGIIGADLAAKAAPDGYTLMYATPGTQITNPLLIKSLPYDPKAFVTVAPVLEAPNVLVVNREVPANNVQELVDLARRTPGNLNFSSSGMGSTQHLSGELFKNMADVDVTHVAYKGSGPATVDLLAGNVQMAIDTLAVQLPHIRSGAMRALGVTTQERHPLLPDVPTVAETLPGFSSSALNYILAPARTPSEVVEKLTAAFAKVLSKPEVRARLLELGTIPVVATPAELDARVAAEQGKWKKVIEGAGITPQG